MAKAPSTGLDLKALRNIGIIAHIDAGKTTTSEHLLYYAGVKHKLGAVDSGNTETDFDPEEQERGITIYSACIPFTWKGHTVNLIDTPGHVDFTAEVERSLRVLDGAVCVFDAQKGVEAQSETVWRQANKYGVPRLVFINKMDIVAANFDRAIESINTRITNYGEQGKPVPIVVPVGSGGKSDSATPFRAVIDLITLELVDFAPSSGSVQDGKVETRTSIRDPEMLVKRMDQLGMKGYDASEIHESAFTYRNKLLDVLTENDDQDLITSAVLNGEEPDVQKIRQLVREQCLAVKIYPVLCGSGREHIGIQPVMDAIIYYLPCPLDRPPIVGTNPKKEGKEEKRKPDFKEPFCGLVFKVIASDHGDLFYIRLYSGTLKGNSRVSIAGKDAKEVIGKLFHVHADPKADREDLPEAYAGDIVATIGLKEAVTGDTLCETQHPIQLEKIVFAEAVVTQNIEPDSNADKDKLIDCLKKLEREDPTFICQINKETGQLIMSGMGTLHLEVKKHRLERDFKLKVKVRQPSVSFRETIRDNKTVTGECIRQAGTTSLFAKLTVSFESRVGGKEPTGVTNKLKPGDLPANLMAAAERGLKSALQSGELGFPLLNVHGTIIKCEMDPETSNEVAFEAAAADAVSRALRDNIVLMEPIMRLNVTVPEEFLGNVIGDLMSRRAEIDRQDSNGRTCVIDARVPLEKMFDYADKVRSLTQGRAGSTMEPHSYAAAPDERLRSFIDPDY